MRPSAASILKRHRETLRGRLRRIALPSVALGIAKTFYVYEPPGHRRGMATPVVWLLRGHEREWANIAEDRSRSRSTAVEDIDTSIAAGTLPPVVLVLPGLTSDNNHVHGLGIEMVAPSLAPHTGMGTGRFWSYLSDEMIPWVEARYPATRRIAAGFSLGGYTVSLLAFGRPGWLDVAAFYDALFCWPGHDDPREEGHQPLGDRIWTASPVLSPAFGWPRDVAALARWNTTDWLFALDGDALAKARSTLYRVQCAGSDGSRGNRDRAHAFATWLEDRGLPTADVPVVLGPDAQHTWHWADRFLLDTLHADLGSSTPDTEVLSGHDG